MGAVMDLSTATHPPDVGGVLEDAGDRGLAPQATANGRHLVDVQVGGDCLAASASDELAEDALHYPAFVLDRDQEPVLEAVAGGPRAVVAALAGKGGRRLGGALGDAVALELADAG